MALRSYVAIILLAITFLTFPSIFDTGGIGNMRKSINSTFRLGTSHIFGHNFSLFFQC